ncbi:hypothetical protein H8356DRAFT_1350514 [Neocallimastix lanati (nom. inval.)]|nr:hypothetical protein H8356DRAFT_1350514 [Neocallimastix sp. JGI-2020a]
MKIIAIKIKKYKCTEYKTLNKCPSFIILNNENQILEYDDSHNHLENKFEAAKSIVKNKITDEILNSSIPFNVNIKRKYDEISQGLGLICPRYNSIKSHVTRSRRKHYETENWNYYDNIEHITNNVSEFFNKYLKKLFAKKPTFFQLLLELQKEESKYYIDYERRTATEEVKALVKHYKKMEILLKKKVLEMISSNYG